MRHNPYFAYEEGNRLGTTYGEVSLALPRRVVPNPLLPRAPRVPQRNASAIVDFIVEGFETKGKREGLRRAAAQSSSPNVGNEFIDGAALYLSSRTLDAAGLQQKLADLNAKMTTLGELHNIDTNSQLGRHRARNRAIGRHRSLGIQKRFIERRLMSIQSKPQAVADMPEIPEKEGTRPSWIPYLSLGIALAGFTMALASRKGK